jgi:hypothetical protein
MNGRIVSTLIILLAVREAAYVASRTKLRPANKHSKRFESAKNQFSQEDTSQTSNLKTQVRGPARVHHSKMLKKMSKRVLNNSQILSKRNLADANAMYTTQLVIGIVMTLVTVGLLGYCAFAEMSKDTETCGFLSWIGSGIFAALGIKYIKDSAGKMGQRKLAMLSPERQARLLYGQRNLKNAYSAETFSSIFKAAMKLIKGEDLSKVDISSSKAVFKFVRQFLGKKFPEARKGINESIREISRLSNFS